MPTTKNLRKASYDYSNRVVYDPNKFYLKVLKVSKEGRGEREVYIALCRSYDTNVEFSEPSRFKRDIASVGWIRIITDSLTGIDIPQKSSVFKYVVEMPTRDSRVNVIIDSSMSGLLREDPILSFKQKFSRDKTAPNTSRRMRAFENKSSFSKKNDEMSYPDALQLLFSAYEKSCQELGILAVGPSEEDAVIMDDATKTIISVGPAAEVPTKSRITTNPDKNRRAQARMQQEADLLVQSMRDLDPMDRRDEFRDGLRKHFGREERGEEIVEKNAKGRIVSENSQLRHRSGKSVIQVEYPSVKLRNFKIQEDKFNEWGARSASSVMKPLRVYLQGVTDLQKFGVRTMLTIIKFVAIPSVFSRK